MTTTEEIIVSGEDFIERRIIMLPEGIDIEGLKARTYTSGYQQGWWRGVLIGFVIFGVAAAGIWLALFVD